MSTKLNELKVALKEFEAVQSQYRGEGAEDGNATAVFHTFLLDMVRLRKPEFPHHWELFSEPASAALAAASRKCEDVIKSCVLVELLEVRDYLSGYCWRASA